jgi:glycosyltransferase involved in cell wall biosynthesis
MNATREARVETTYITRKYPPSVGGMETLALNTKLALDQVYGRSSVIAMKRSNAHLLWWVPLAAVQISWDAARHRSATYLFGDALAWALLGWIPALWRRPSFTMVCGLDITYSNPLYQKPVLAALRRAARVIAISRATLNVAIEAGVNPAVAHVLTMGVIPADGSRTARTEARKDLRKRFGLADDSVVLLTTGRLVERKGVRWFVENVMPLLDKRFHYFVVGNGAQREIILKTADSRGVADRVHLLGYISDADRQFFLEGSDFFVQPNVSVPDDMEGFGLVVVEAAQAGLLTVASPIEGLADSVRPNLTGITLPSGDGPAWATGLTELSNDPNRDSLAEQFQSEALRIFSLRTMGSELNRHITELTLEPDETPNTANARRA